MNNKETVIVSVIIPTYKGYSTLGRAINSVLKQTYGEFEIIVVDDNDPESEARKKTEIVIDSFSDKRIKYIKHKKNMNGSVARNTGIKHSIGKYIAFLDDDDIYFSERIRKSVEALENNKEYGMVFCDVLHAYGEWYGCIHKANSNWLSPKGVLLHIDAIGSGSNLFLRRTVIEAINGFDENFLRHQDLEFAIRATENAKAFVINETLILKCFNETCNHPNFEKLYNIKNQYSKKFEKIILSLPPEKQKEFYLNSFCDIYHVALESRKIKNVRIAIDYGKKHCFKCSLKQKLQFIYYILRIDKLVMNDKNKVKKESKDFSDIFELCNHLSNELRDNLLL